MTTIPQITKDCRTAMEKSFEASKRELGSIRTGKATASLLDTVRVEAYGQQMPLNQVAGVSAPEPRLLTVTPWDKGLVTAIEKALRQSDLGRHPGPAPFAQRAAQKGAGQGRSQAGRGSADRHPPRANGSARSAEEAREN